MQTMLAASLEQEGKHTVYSIYFNFQASRHPGAYSFREEFFHFFLLQSITREILLLVVETTNFCFVSPFVFFQESNFQNE